MIYAINSVTIKDFRVYKGTHEFVFPKNFGLYYFTGLNKAESALGANGAGKSTFLDAIVWCLYGVTPRGLRANEVIAWGTDKGCQVIVDLTIGNSSLKVKRTQRPNNLLLISDNVEKPVDQKELQKHIILNLSSFLRTVLFHQFNEPFLGLKPNEKLTLFSDIMNLEFWLERSLKATELTNKKEIEVSDLVEKLHSYTDQLEAINDDITSLEVQKNSYNTDTDAKALQLSNEIQNLTKDNENTANQIIEFKKQKRDLQGSLRKAISDRATLIETRDSKLKYLGARSKFRQRCLVNIENAESELKEVQSLTDSCPLCDQVIPPALLSHKKQIIVRKIHEFKMSLKNSNEALRVLTTEIIQAKLAVESKDMSIDRYNKELSDLNKSIYIAETDWENISKNIDDRARQRDDLLKVKNPYKELLDKKHQKLVELKKQIKLDKDALDTLEIDLESTRFWIKGFKRVRLFIIEQAFKTLEVEVNNSLAQLGMPDWQISFDIERENKAGSITKGFVVFVKSPRNNKPVRWENWSGGETQRLQLAGDLGLANLIMQQNGLRNTIEFYDEPSVHLSPEGMLDLAALLHERAISEEKQIWVIDHAAITDFGSFQGVITARKTENGSEITYRDA